MTAIATDISNLAPNFRRRIFSLRSAILAVADGRDDLRESSRVRTPRHRSHACEPTPHDRTTLRSSSDPSRWFAMKRETAAQFSSSRASRSEVNEDARCRLRDVSFSPLASQPTNEPVKRMWRKRFSAAEGAPQRYLDEPDRCSLASIPPPFGCLRSATVRGRMHELGGHRAPHWRRRSPPWRVPSRSCGTMPIPGR